MEKKLSKKMMLCWPTSTISYAVGSALLGFVTFYATDVMGISAVSAGMIFMLSKIFDGITDVIAGYLIDHTYTKFGKGRPYTFSIVGYWLAVVFLFSAPKLGATAAAIYLFVMYSLINSVFLTLYLCSEPVYMANAIDNSNQSVTLSAVTGFISMIFTMVTSMILPQIVAKIGTSREGWSRMTLVIAIPFALIGMIRFLGVKEKKKGTVSAAQNFSIKEMLSLLAKNKYILIFSIIVLISNIGSNLVNSATTYYFTYIVGDIGLSSLMSLAMLAIVVVMVITPALSNKFGFVNVMRATTLIGMFGYLIRLAAPTNLVLLFVSTVLAMLGFYTMFSFAATFVIQCVDYGEWKNSIRSEGTISCAQSVTAKIGTAIGLGLIGVLMGMSGYDGTATVQSGSANTMIIMLYTVIPAVFCLIQFIMLKLYDLDKLLPTITKELEERRNKVD